jgi:excinuclease ABC subunit A
MCWTNLPLVFIRVITIKLLDTLKGLRDLGNTVLVVEPTKNLRNADWIVDLGPGAGEYGGCW